MKYHIMIKDWSETAFLDRIRMCYYRKPRILTFCTEYSMEDALETLWRLQDNGNRHETHFIRIEDEDGSIIGETTRR